MRVRNFQDAIFPTKEGTQVRQHQSAQIVCTYKSDADGFVDINTLQETDDTTGCVPILFGDDADGYEEAYAKITFNRTQPIYWVKMNERNHMVNPLKDGDLQDTRIGIKTMREKWKYRRVSKKSFRQYAAFLRTGNELYIRQAERDV